MCSTRTRRFWRGLSKLALLGVIGLPALAQASPGCQALNGQSGTLSGHGYIQLLTNSQQVNQGDYVTLTSSGTVLYGGSFLQLTSNANTVSGAETSSGAGADNLSNLLNSSATYSITCQSAGATISGVSPASATVGSTTTISGSGFWGATQVLFGAMPATSFTVTYGSGNPIINAVVPNGSGTVTITVVTDAGTYSGGSFTFAAPTAGPSSASVAFNSSNNAIPLSISGSPSSVAVASAPAHGVATATGTTITYSPAASYTGPDSFTYTATNAAGTSSPATVTITVNPPAAPTVAAVSATTPYNTATNINLASAITGTDITAVTIASAPTHGTASVSGETVTYTPSATFYGGTDSFTYTATNPGGTSAPATVTVTVNAVGIPTVSATSVTTPYNTPSSINLASAIAGVDITAVTIASAPTHGTATVSGETVTYTPSATFYGGTDSFTYTATNPGGTSTPATVTVTVNAVGAPTVSATSVTTPYNTAAHINLASAVTGTAITAITIASAPAHGTATVSGETVTYTPSATYYGGMDSFTYTATNPGGTSAPAAVTVTVGALPIPTAAAKSATTPYNTATNIDLTSAISGTGVTGILIASSPAHGTVSTSGQTVTYTPSSTFYGGTDTFTYTAVNPGGHSTPATVTITVTPLSTPVAAALSVVTTKATPVLIEAAAVATGPQPLTGATVASPPMHGTAAANGEQIVYTPAAGFVGTDTFNYQLSNHFGTSAPGTITVTVTAAGSAAGLSQTVSAQPGRPVSVNLATVAPGTYTSSVLLGLSPAGAGAATLSQPTTLTFTPASASHGLVHITALLTATAGQPQVIDILVLVSSQPDPSRNPDALGLINAQTMQAKRFAESQLRNIQSRLDSLHDGNATPSFSNNVSISLDGKPMQAPTGVAANGRSPAAFGTPSSTGLRPGMGVAESGDSASAPADTTPQGSAPTAQAPTSSGLGVWINGVANFGSFDAYRRAAGFDSDNIAVNAGVDQRIGEQALIGFSFGYNHDRSEVGNNGTRSVAQGYSAAIYGSYQPTSHLYIDGVLGGGGLRFDSRRYATDSGTLLAGHRNGNQWFTSLTAGYAYEAGTWAVSPYGRLAWSLSSFNGYAESGDAAEALSYGTQTVRTSQVSLGIRASGKMAWNDNLFMPHARLEVGHDFQGASNTTLGYAFVPTAGSWNVLTNPYSSGGSSVQAGVGGDWQLRNDLLITTEYQYLLMPHAHDQSIRIGVHKQF